MSVAIDLAGRRALIVGGGGGGIGSCMVDVVARAGADVAVISYVEEHATASVAHIQSLGRRGASAVCDVTNETDLVGAIGQLADELGPFDHVVNVVGGALADDWHRAAEYDLDAFDRVMARNLRYAVTSCREVATSMIARGVGGTMVNLSSAAARGTPLLGAYGAAKAGLESFGRTMALEWAPYGIRVNAVAPGTIKTPRSGSSDMADAAAREIPLGRRGEPEEIANAALFFLSDLSSYITGVTLGVDGGTAMGSHSGDTLPVFVTNPAVRARFGQ